MLIISCTLFAYVCYHKVFTGTMIVTILFFKIKFILKLKNRNYINERKYTIINYRVCN